MARPPKPTAAEKLNAQYAFGFPLWTPRPSDGRRALVSGPWGYVRYNLQAAPKVAKQAEAFWEQGEDFYRAAEDTSPAARPLLYYYSFMNMVKAFLILRGRALKQSESHGVLASRPTQHRSHLQTQELVVKDGSSTATSLLQEFATELGMQLRGGTTLKVGQLLQQVVGVHRAWMSVTRSDSLFAVGDVHLRKSKAAQAVFASIAFSSKDRALADNVASKAGWKRVEAPEPDNVYYETALQQRTGRSYQRVVSNLTRDLKGRMHLLLTENDGYRIYFSHFGLAEPRRLPQLVAMYAVMFFLGSITRYRPYDFDRYVDGKWGWLVNEFINSQPPQFRYLLASEIANNEVVLPLGRITIDAV